MQEKEELLSLHDEEQKREVNLSFKTLVMVYLAVFIAIFLPKIYIANQIYYISRDIADISGKRDMLLEENRALNIKLENLRYKNQILNNMQERQWK